MHVVYRSRLYSATVAGYLVLITTPTYSFITDTESAEVHYYKSLRRDEVIGGMSTHSLYIMIGFLTWGKPKIHMT